MATNKQKALAKKILENPTLTEVTSADMVAVGYSPTTRPSEIVNSEGWQKLIEKHLPDDKLLTKHEEALEAKKWNDFTGEREPDHVVRLKAIDLAYKLKGKVGQPQVNILNQGGDMSLEFSEK